MDVATIIDAAAPTRVLVVGSLPPVGRDYDLFVRDSDRAAIVAALGARGFEPVGHRWVRFEPGDLDVVELITPADWGLSDHETEALFTQATPLDRRARLCVPAPAHQLLILARALPRTPGLLRPKHRDLVQDALAQAPDAWIQAGARAAEWRVERRLRALRSRSARPQVAGWPPQYLRRPRRGAVIALSGLDGAGKSTQAEALRVSLSKLGFEATVIWAPIGSTPSLRRFAAVVKRSLARLPVGPLAHADRGSADRRLLSQTHDGVPVGGRRRRFAALLWATVIALVNAASYRRSGLGASIGGRIIIYDRYVLDSIVDLRFSYAPQGRLRFQEALLRLLAPAPRCAFLLEADVETAHARKPDWSIAQTRERALLYRCAYEPLRVWPVDAERPVGEISREIVRAVLDAIAR